METKKQSNDEQSNDASLATLPFFTLLKILTYVTTIDIGELARTNKQFNALLKWDDKKINDAVNALFKFHLTIDFPEWEMVTPESVIDTKTKKAIPAIINYREQYLGALNKFLETTKDIMFDAETMESFKQFLRDPQKGAKQLLGNVDEEKRKAIMRPLVEANAEAFVHELKAIFQGPGKQLKIDTILRAFYYFVEYHKKKPNQIWGKSEITRKEKFFAAVRYGQIDKADEVIQHATEEEIIEAINSIVHEDNIPLQTMVEYLVAKRMALIGGRRVLEELEMAAGQGQWNMYDIIFNAGIDVTQAQDVLKTLLSYCYDKDTPKAMHAAKQLIEAGVPLDFQMIVYSYVTTILYTACMEYSDVEVVKALIARGLDVNEPGFQNMRPLHAIAGRNPDIVKVLLENDADVALEDDSGNQPINLINYSYLEGTKQAEWQANLETLNLLVAKDADVNHARANGTTPLIKACNFGPFEAVKLLIRHGANIEVTNQRGATPLREANARRDEDGKPIVEYLNYHLALNKAADKSPREKVIALLQHHVSEMNAGRHQVFGQQPIQKLLTSLSHQKTLNVKELVELMIKNKKQMPDMLFEIIQESVLIEKVPKANLPKHTK